MINQGPSPTSVAAPVSTFKYDDNEDLSQKDGRFIQSQIETKDGNISTLRQVLDEAEYDLLDADFGIANPLVNPVRHLFLGPALGVASNVFPVISTKIPLLDDLAAASCHAGFALVKAAYCAVPHGNDTTDDDSADQAVRGPKSEVRHVNEVAEKELAKMEPSPLEKMWVLPGDILQFIAVKPKEFVSLVQAAVGFGATTALDIVTAPFTGKLSDWFDTVRAFRGYLLFTGLDKKLLPAFFTPRVFDNLAILANGQAQLNVIGNCSSRRQRSSMDHYPVETREFLPLLRDSEAYFRYMAAAYGSSVIAATNSLLGKNGSSVSDKEEPFTFNKKEMADYVGVSEEDIVHITSPNATADNLAHFVAVDHHNEAVVLAIRGTFSISEVFTDAEAWNADFCGGIAHKGISERASNLWVDPNTKKPTDTQLAVAKALLYTYHTTGKMYTFVIAGHSLGGGASACLNLKIYHDNPPNELITGVKGVKVKCYAVACPPVFCHKNMGSRSSESAVQKAMENCISFIHEDDCVPFLSVDAVRRLANVLSELDEETKNINLIERRLLAENKKDLPKDIKALIKTESLTNISIKNMARRFAIPSKFVLWFRKSGEEGSSPIFDAHFCDPDDVKELDILLSPNMINDHMPPFYVRAIENVLERVEDGYENVLCIGGTCSPRDLKYIF